MSGPKSTFAARKYSPLDPLYKEINDSGFFRVETLSDLLPTDLAGPIHGLLRRSNFPKTKFDYEALKNPLKLTTMFIKVLAPEFHTMLFNEPYYCEDRANTSFYVFPEPEKEISGDKVKATSDRLWKLGDHIKFDLLPEGDTNLASFRTDPTSKTFGTMGTGLPGVPGTIFLSRWLVNNLTDSMKDPDDIVRQQYWSLLLACTIVHELAHAVNYAVTTLACNGQNNRFYLGDGQTTEIGYEVESRLLGGVILYCRFTNTKWYEYKRGHSKLGRLITTIEWPSHRIFSQYKNGRSHPIVLWEEPDEKQIVDILWNTDFCHINRLFRQSFWDDVVSREGIQSIHLKKETGYLFTTNVERDSLLEPLPLSVPCDVLDDFARTAKGLVRRKALGWRKRRNLKKNQKKNQKRNRGKKDEENREDNELDNKDET